MKISVIVCTYNRAHAITKCLNSIADSLAAAAPVEGEIVVVDNASTDDTAAVIKKWAVTCAFPVQALYEPKQGVSAARNCAIRAARGELLAITDDDCCLSREYVRDALRHDAADTEPVLRGGRVELGDPTDLPLTILTDPAPVKWRRPAKGSKYVHLGSGLILGCNMALRRTLAGRIGFFDERFGPGTGIPAGEDTDYLFRAYIADITIGYVPGMTIFHFHGRKTVPEGKKLLHNYAIGEGALYAKYLFKEPNLCRNFYWDFRNMIRDIIAGKNTFLPGMGFAYKDKIIFNVRGAFKYCLVALRKPVSWNREDMNILFITAQPFTPQVIGGLQSSATELALLLAKRGHKVSLLCALMSNGMLGIRDRLIIKLLRWKAAPDTVPGFPVWRAWFPWEAVGWLAKSNKPDLVIVLAGQPARMALAARAAGVPVLMMLQDVTFEGHGADFSNLGKVPCVANSQFTADRYRQAFGVEPVVIPPLIDGQKKYKTETTRENVTFINPNPVKGLEIALAVARQCPDIPFSFVEAWYLGPKGRHELKEKLAAAPNVTLRPSVLDMHEVYGKCKILLAPSICEEAYGRVVTEAQFSGIPVIASNRGGLPEAVGQGGILLDPERDIENWVAVVRKLWSDDAYYAELSAAARAHADRPALRRDTQLGMWEDIIATAARSGSA